MKAKIGLRQYMKAKPTKWCVKLLVLANSSNRVDQRFCHLHRKEQFHFRVDFLARCCQQSHGCIILSYHLYVDHFYTSQKLFSDSYAKRFGACGTFKASCRNVTKTNTLMMHPMDQRAGTVVCEVDGHKSLMETLSPGTCIRSKLGGGRKKATWHVVMY